MGRPITIVTAVWGDWHSDAFLRFNLSSLFSPGNIPALSQRHPIRFLIFTRSADLDRLRSSEQFHVLGGFAEISFELMPESDLSDPIAAHHKAWDRAGKLARARGDLLLHMPPDVIWSCDSLEFVVQRLAQGYTSVFMTYLRSLETCFLEELEERRDTIDGSLRVPSRDLVRLALNHAHPLMGAHMRQSEFFAIHPEMLVWPVAREGIAVRLLVREMFLFDPAEVALSNLRLPADSLGDRETTVVEDSDQLFAVSLAALGQDAHWHNVPRTADEVVIGRWWLTYDSPFNDRLVKARIRWHYTDASKDAWERVERGADLFVRRLVVTREGLRVWRAARALGCSRAGFLLSIAILTRLFARTIRGAGSAYIFLPSDSAVDDFTESQWLELFQDENQSRLGELIRAHYAYAPELERESGTPIPLPDALRRTKSLELHLATGRGLMITSEDGEILADGFPLVAESVKAGSHLVYRVEGLLSGDDPWTSKSS